MELLNKLKGYEIKYLNDIPYFEIEGYVFFYYLLNGKDERMTICLNKPLIQKSDINIINKQVKEFAKTSIDNIAFKNDLLFIEFFDYSDLYTKLLKIKNILFELNYFNRSNCILCGKKTSLNIYKKAVVPIDDECINKLNIEQENNEKTNKNYKTKSILMSILGAFIGVLPTILLNFLLGSYTIMSTILLFLSPFLSVVFYNLTPVMRTKDSDIFNFIISLIFVILVHVFIVFMYSYLYEVKSINHYFDIFNYLLLETFIETVLAYVIGLFSGYFISKKRILIKISKQKK